MTSSAAVPVGPDGGRDKNGERPLVHMLAERLKERIYAQLSVVAVALGLALSEVENEAAAASTMAATAVGLWLATIAADQQAHGGVRAARPGP